MEDSERTFFERIPERRFVEKEEQNKNLEKQQILEDSKNGIWKNKKSWRIDLVKQKHNKILENSWKKLAWRKGRVWNDKERFC